MFTITASNYSFDESSPASRLALMETLVKIVGKGCLGDDETQALRGLKAAIAAGAATNYYSNGKPMSIGDAYYYPNGRNLNIGDTYYYPNGRNLNIGGTYYYPNGKNLNIGETYYYPDGNTANSEDSLLTLALGKLTANVQVLRGLRGRERKLALIELGWAAHTSS